MPFWLFAVVWVAVWAAWVVSYARSFRAAVRRRYGSPLPDDVRSIARWLVVRRASMLAPIPATLVAFAVEAAWLVLS